MVVELVVVVGHRVSLVGQVQVVFNVDSNDPHNKLVNVDGLPNDPVPDDGPLLDVPLLELFLAVSEPQKSKYQRHLQEEAEEHAEKYHEDDEQQNGGDLLGVAQGHVVLKQGGNGRDGSSNEERSGVHSYPDGNLDPEGKNIEFPIVTEDARITDGNSKEGERGSAHAGLKSGVGI
eukprot:CAMPEP_0170493600 /NCGR_PEP_ID=MMETSP0208-20121228/14158_1 /TAXON_ID=197538 /ORGANISM="Strombidium inclinatum, Strain S3" /LENGTH=175 /DNA_ID=CAMNT_0010769549 /DNA_START=77 /DNA_END=604 /DNA_ORIENTATION=-